MSKFVFQLFGKVVIVQYDKLQRNNLLGTCPLYNFTWILVTAHPRKLLSTDFLASLKVKAVSDKTKQSLNLCG